jgi:hypothetical protein
MIHVPVKNIHEGSVDFSAYLSLLLTQEEIMRNSRLWKEIKPKDFWGEIAPCEHVLQIYDNNEIFINTLAGFVGDGINAGDCTIVLATREHLQSLDTALSAHGINVGSLISEDQYIPIVAEDALALFMINDWPDPALFLKMVTGLFNRASKNNRNVRAFGELVAVLWAQGNNGATVQLEHLWNQFCAQNQMTLFCAYPKSGFTEDAEESIKSICATHSKIISGSKQSLTTLRYQA